MSVVLAFVEKFWHHPNSRLHDQNPRHRGKTPRRSVIQGDEWSCKILIVCCYRSFILWVVPIPGNHHQGDSYILVGNLHLALSGKGDNPMYTVLFNTVLPRKHLLTAKLSQLRDHAMLHVLLPGLIQCYCVMMVKYWQLVVMVVDSSLITWVMDGSQHTFPVNLFNFFCVMNNRLRGYFDGYLMFLFCFYTRFCLSF